MTIKRIVFSKIPTETDVLFVTLYKKQNQRQLGIVSSSRFFVEQNCTIYQTYKEILKEITNHTLLYIDFLEQKRGVIFTYDGDQRIEYYNTYFSLSDPFFKELFHQYIYKEQYQEKLKILTESKKNDTL